MNGDAQLVVCGWESSRPTTVDRDSIAPEVLKR